MTACSAAAPTMTSRVIKSDLHVNSELSEQLDPMELSSVNELLDRIAALGVATDYSQIGLKTDLREINSPGHPPRRSGRRAIRQLFASVEDNSCPDS